MFKRDQTYFGGLFVREDLRVDSVELQDDFIHQLRVQSPLFPEEAAVLGQLVTETVCEVKPRTSYRGNVLGNECGQQVSSFTQAEFVSSMLTYMWRDPHPAVMLWMGCNEERDTKWLSPAKKRNVQR